MRLRPPAVPLITVDPYFSVWSPNEVLNFAPPQHWTGANQTITAYAIVDGKAYSFLGYNRNAAKMKQNEMDVDALNTRATYENGMIRLYVTYMTPLFLDDLVMLTRPVSYMFVTYESIDGKEHEVRIDVNVNDQICLNRAGESPVVIEAYATEKTNGFKMGNTVQDVLNKSGDDIRINWGYFHLTSPSNAKFCPYTKGVGATLSIYVKENEEATALFAYDDVKSINYFGKHLSSYWNKDGQTIASAIDAAVTDVAEIRAKAEAFSDALIAEAYEAGGEKYADLLSLAYRQVIAAHKVAVDENGDLLYISKECFSNGCCATVDVSYPSIPLFLRYNPELIKGMLRPIYKFAKCDEWKYDFAPHDAGRYPLCTGQVYGLNKETGELMHHMQMPVEECGNMIIMETNIAIATKDASFAKENIDTLKSWCEYLIKYGDDPENQLCTDDFAGHLAHNCNLSLKAIMGIEGMSILCDMLGDSESAANYHAIAKDKAARFVVNAANPDGLSYKLAYDREGSFSMKYNMVWDKLWGTELFPKEMVANEIRSNMTHFNEYGMPLDSRADYTKSDWLVWTATLAESKSDFKKFIAPLWKFYNETPDRYAMTDWYDTIYPKHIEFVHRTVQGGLYIKLLDATDFLKVK